MSHCTTILLYALSAEKFRHSDEVALVAVVIAFSPLPEEEPEQAGKIHIAAQRVAIIYKVCRITKKKAKQQNYGKDSRGHPGRDASAAGNCLPIAVGGRARCIVRVAEHVLG